MLILYYVCVGNDEVLEVIKGVLEGLRKFGYF